MRRAITILAIAALLVGAAPFASFVVPNVDGPAHAYESWVDSCACCGYVPGCCYRCLWDLAWEGLRDDDWWWWE